MADAVETVKGVFGAGLSSFAFFKWILIALVIFSVIGGIAFIIGYIKKSKDRWNLEIRVRMEDTQNNKIYLEPIIVKGKRVTLSNGLRLIYLDKEILGKRLFPLLNFHTRPGVYDLVITSDNRIFIITGISGIDEQRKELKVGIRYPGVDYSLEEVNRDHAKLNQEDRRSDLLAMVKAGAMVVIAIVILVAFIVGGKYYIEGKDIDRQIDTAQLSMFEALERTTISQEEQTNAMIILTDKLKETLGVDNLRFALVNSTG